MARTSPPGSPRAERKCSSQLAVAMGTGDTQFVEAYLSVSPGWRARRTTRKRRAHGFVRTKAWAAETIARDGDGVTVSMSPKVTKTRNDGRPAEFRLVYRVTFASELRLELVVTNTGKASVRFEEPCMRTTEWGISLRREWEVCARSIISIRPTRIGRRFSTRRSQSSQKPIALYLNTSDAIELEDPVLSVVAPALRKKIHARLCVESLVQKAHSLSDFADDDGCNDLHRNQQPSPILPWISHPASNTK